MSNTSKRRFGYKLDQVFWFLVMVLPILCYLVINWANPTAIGFFAFMDTFSPFAFVQEIFDDITQAVFSTTFALTSYLGYLVGVEVFHVMFDVVVFIPRMAHKFVSKAVQDD